MSHDRGCSCGREQGEYRQCPKLDCSKRNMVTRWDEESGHDAITKPSSRRLNVSQKSQTRYRPTITMRTLVGSSAYFLARLTLLRSAVGATASKCAMAGLEP